MNSLLKRDVVNTIGNIVKGIESPKICGQMGLEADFRFGILRLSRRVFTTLYVPPRVD